MILEPLEAPLQQLCLHGNAVMVHSQTLEMLRNKFMPQEQRRDDIGSLQSLNTATLPAWERRNGPNSNF